MIRFVQLAMEAASQLCTRVGRTHTLLGRGIAFHGQQKDYRLHSQAPLPSPRTHHRPRVILVVLARWSLQAFPCLGVIHCALYAQKLAIAMGFTDITTVDAFDDAIKNSKMVRLPTLWSPQQVSGA